MADNSLSGAFSKWAGRKMPSDVRNFSNWAYSEATSHPIDRLVNAMNTGRVAPVERKEIIPAPTEKYKVSPNPGAAKVPDMLKSKYWRPGASRGGSQ